MLSKYLNTHNIEDEGESFFLVKCDGSNRQLWEMIFKGVRESENAFKNLAKSYISGLSGRFFKRGCKWDILRYILK
jgi:hypothetical protein